MAQTETTFSNVPLTDREAATVDGIITAIKEIAMSRMGPGEQNNPFVCNQDDSIKTLASLALAVIRHGLLAGGA